MLKQRQRNVYRKPKIVSEKIFEQAALACSGMDMGTPPAAQANTLKNNVRVCEFAHS
ncbi:MAG: hypothetical protein AB1696_22880 [Planctomycetota bacterium]